MRDVLAWVRRRLGCTVQGHRFRPGRIYSPKAKSIVPGYACDRCGKTRMWLYRWESTVEDDESA